MIMTDAILEVLYNKSIQRFKCFKWMFNWTWKVTFQIPILDLTFRYIVSKRGFFVGGLCSPTQKQPSIHIWHDKDGFVFHDSKRLIKFSETFEILVAATFSGGNGIVI